MIYEWSVLKLILKIVNTMKLTTDGLLVGYYDYWTSRGPGVIKPSGINMNFNITTNLFDQYIATFQHSDYQQIKKIIVT